MADTKVPITITYRAPHIQPPLYVAGTFSHPQWVPQEMEYTTGEDREFTFSKAFDVEPNSKIQYKFRAGPGDWWVLDESAPIVTDDAGNRNNFIEAPSAEEAKPEEPIQPTNHDDDDVSSSDHAQQPQPQPHPIARLESLKETEKVDRSETSTPEYARTAAEVAESAALVDPPTPLPEPVDDVASDPSQEAANTAAEVADSAQNLDKNLAEEQTETVVPVHETIADIKSDLQKDVLDIAGFSNDHEPAPLFAHECAGLYEDDEIPGVPEEEQHDRIVNGKTRDQDKEDFSDPTLEQFPSSKSEILATVRKVETGLNANQTLNAGVPPSPIFRTRTRSSGDGQEEPTSPKLSPVPSKESQHLSLSPAQPLENLGERSLSAVSLGSIAEDEEADTPTAKQPAAEEPKAEAIAPIVEQAETAEEAINVAKEAEGDITLDPAKSASRPVVTVPNPSVKTNNDLISPVSDEDEAVVIKDGQVKDKNVEIGHSGYLTPARAATPEPEEPGSPSEPAPNTAEQIQDASPLAGPEPEETSLPVPPSPKIVVSEAEEIAPQNVLAEAPVTNGNGHKDIQPPSSGSGQDETGSRSEPAATSAIEDSQPSALKKRSAPQSDSRDRSGTPAPIPDNDWEAAKNGNWFSAFFRWIFVDWVGGFVSGLCGRRRKTT
ncbi:hypothetical protein DHEL01_v201426 [Diaporthe helianthi]|uniref:AMP-activated protein kinase glycogen-binding domain-containing protein n=1 Tax=Diaporthe helianthi TaxID=158607 RepID=A0A2P5ICE3_DIAHE|nr:hypothetical protein DHEL01_v201426 [Diaporthe helianthi]